jgi:hypothetical protein
MASQRRTRRWATRTLQMPRFPSIGTPARSAGQTCVRQTYSATKKTPTAAIRPASNGRMTKWADRPGVSAAGIVRSRRRTRASTRSQLRSENAARETGAFAALWPISGGTSIVPPPERVVQALRAQRKTGHR